MRELFGINASSGYGIGSIYIYSPSEIKVSKESGIDKEYQKAKLEKAISMSLEQLRELQKNTAKALGDDADIFLAHISMVEDPDLKESIVAKIEEGFNVEWSVDETIKEYIKTFEDMDNEYFKERALDIQDIGKRILANLMGSNMNSLSELEKKIILVAKELTPSDTVTMDKDKVIGMITETGGKTSHTAIIARTLGIPAVTGIDNITSIVEDDQHIIIDGTNGKVILEAEEEQVAAYDNLIQNHKEELESLKAYMGCKTETKDGFQCKLHCNIGSLEDTYEVLKHDGEGVGLFRTEFLYMSKQQPPTEEEQYDVYSRVGNLLGKKEVIIRTLDVGGDKGIDYIHVGEELNPFLGNRAIRYCLQEKNLLLTQLKAVLRAANGTSIKVMFPMITAFEELVEAKELLERAKQELRVEGKAFNENISVGIMIETPAAVFNSNQLAKEVDFFSIGSNDLIQYTCAVDRMNTNVSNLYSPYNPAIIKSIKMVVENAHREDVDVGICGEAASEELLLPVWVSLGIDELSVTSGNILRIRKEIRQMNRDSHLVHKALECRSEEEMIKLLEGMLKK